MNEHNLLCADEGKRYLFFSTNFVQLQVWMRLPSDKLRTGDFFVFSLSFFCILNCQNGEYAFRAAPKENSFQEQLENLIAESQIQLTKIRHLTFCIRQYEPQQKEVLDIKAIHH